jgi:hypothetical protein
MFTKLIQPAASESQNNRLHPHRLSTVAIHNFVIPNVQQFRGFDLNTGSRWLALRNRQDFFRNFRHLHFRILF